MMNTQHRTEVFDNHVWVRFVRPRSVLSSAILNGGWCEVSNLLIMKVAGSSGDEAPDLGDPAVTLQSYSDGLGIEGAAAGMMTSASMDSYREICKTEQGVEITAIVTTGLSNALCAGDWAGVRQFDTPRRPSGTINIVVITNALLAQAAMVESVMMIAEAKAVAMRELGVRSIESGKTATGTGTDAVAIINGWGPANIRYAGKHVLFGELLATAVIDAIKESLKDRLSQYRHCRPDKSVES